MIQFRTVLYLAIFLSLLSCTPEEEGPPLLHMPQDLKATLWAESPMFFNPTNIDVDYRGRLWVTEAVNYRNFNNDSIANAPRMQGDRVVILEDTDGDGKADTSVVFVQDKDLVSPLGIAVIGKKVFVSCSPNLIVYTDENGDDKPDKKEIFLTGFGGLDHDHSLHAVVGGMDGKLYFNTGNAGPHEVKDKSGWTLRSGSIYTGGTPYNLKNQGNMKSDDGRVWVGGLGLRISPEGTGLQVIAHNFRNSFELAVDSRGDVWQNDNDDQVVACRTTWLMEGANAGFFSEDGTRYWQADQRPWQDIFDAHWHQGDPGVIPAGDRTGAGSPTGVVVNESDALGEEYRGMLLSADAGRNVIFSYHPKPHQSGFDLGKRTNFITSVMMDDEGYVWDDSTHKSHPDKWFRPSDVAIGTDGAIYVADWYDPVVGGHQRKDTAAYGRIYRITPKGERLKSPEVDFNTTDGLLDALHNPAVNVRYYAFEQLKKLGDQIVPKVRRMLREGNPYHQARAVWLLASLGKDGLFQVEKLLKDEDPILRAVAFRALRNRGSDLMNYINQLKDDPSPFVKRELIHSVANWPYDKKKDILVHLSTSFDPSDRWYVEAIGAAVRGNEEDFMMEMARVHNPGNNAPDDWNAATEAMAFRLHPPSYVDELVARSGSSRIDSLGRERAVTALAFINVKSAAEAMLKLTQSPMKDVAEYAAYWISFRQGNDWYALMDWKNTTRDWAAERKLAEMKVRRSKVLDSKLPYNEKKWNLRDMARDPVGANMILAMASENKLPKELYSEVADLMLKNSDMNVRVQALSYFQLTSGKKYNINAIAGLASDAVKGKLSFQENCSSCHRAGKTGGTIGPDLSNIGKKFDRVGLLEAMVNPSAAIVFGYEAWTVVVNEGRSYYGFLQAENADVVVLRDLAGKSHNIPVRDISSRTKNEKSIMPDAGSLALTDEQLGNISAYLLALK